MLLNSTWWKLDFLEPCLFKALGPGTISTGENATEADVDKSLLQIVATLAWVGEMGWEKEGHL